MGKGVGTYFLLPLDFGGVCVSVGPFRWTVECPLT